MQTDRKLIQFQLCKTIQSGRFLGKTWCDRPCCSFDYYVLCKSLTKASSCILDKFKEKMGEEP